MKELTSGNKSAVKKLLEKEPLLACCPLTPDQKTLLHLLVIESSKELIQWLFSQKQIVENTEFNMNAKDSNSWTRKIFHLIQHC